MFISGILTKIESDIQKLNFLWLINELEKQGYAE